MGVAILLGPPALAAAAAPQAFHLTHIEMAVVQHDHYAIPALERAPAIMGPWTEVELPHVTRAVQPNAETGAVAGAWYRAHLSAPATDEPTFLYIPRWQTTGHVAAYADGRLIYAPRSGPIWNSFNLPIWVEIARSGEPPPREILIHIEAKARAAFALSTIWVGPKNALTVRHAARTFLQITAPKWGCIVFILIGLITLMLWASRRQEPAYLLIFAIAATTLAHSIEYFVGVDPVPILEKWLEWIERNAEVWSGALTFIMVTYYIGGATTWMRRGAALFLLGFSSSTALVTVLSLPLERVQLLMWGVSMSANVAGMIVAWLGLRAAPSRHGFLFCVFNSLIFPAALHDMLMARLVIGVESVYLLPLVPLAQTTLFLYIFAARHLEALSEAEAARSTLHHRLGEREAELADAYERLGESERRQMLTNERQRLMRDMHDGVGSSLISALAVVEYGEADAAETAQLLRECLDDLKLAIDSLEPVESDLLLLVATARYRLEPRLEQAGVRLAWRVGELPPLPKIPPENALHVLRIIQEVFTNIVKHAGAKTVDLVMEARGDAVVVEIIDDGVGFDVEKTLSVDDPVQMGRGVSNLFTRAAAIGACIRWRSAPGRTAVEISIPLGRDVVPQRQITTQIASR